MVPLYPFKTSLTTDFPTSAVKVFEIVEKSADNYIRPADPSAKPESCEVVFSWSQSVKVGKYTEVCHTHIFWLRRQEQQSYRSYRHHHHRRRHHHHHQQQQQQQQQQQEAGRRRYRRPPPTTITTTTPAMANSTPRLRSCAQVSSPALRSQLKCKTQKSAQKSPCHEKAEPNPLLRTWRVQRHFPDLQPAQPYSLSAKWLQWYLR